MIPYLALLLPIPPLMYAYGYTGLWFLIIGEAVAVMWLYMALMGFSKKSNTDTWAKKVFLFSISYLMITLLVMILDTVHQ
ncbi:protoheme IX farnesyltransferase [compost metagenome]